MWRGEGLASSPGPLSISQLLLLHAKSNMKSWEIERGPGDEAREGSCATCKGKLLGDVYEYSILLKYAVGRNDSAIVLVWYSFACLWMCVYMYNLSTNSRLFSLSIG